MNATDSNVFSDPHRLISFCAAPHNIMSYKRKKNSCSRKICVDRRSVKCSLEYRGHRAKLSCNEREPILITGLQNLMRRLLTYEDQINYSPSLEWCTLTRVTQISQSVFIVVDGIDVQTVEDLSLNRKKVKKCYDAMVHDGHFLPVKIQTPNEANSTNISEPKKKKHQKVNGVSSNSSTVNKDACNVEKIEVPSSYKLSDTFKCLFSRQNEGFFKNSIEVIAPAKYGRTVLQDLFNVVATDSWLISEFATTIPSTKSLYKASLGGSSSRDHSQEEICTENGHTSGTQSSLPPSSMAYNPTPYWPRIMPGSKHILQPDKFNRKDLILNFTELYENKYPLPHEFMKHPKMDVDVERRNDYDDFIGTKAAYLEVTSTSPMFGLDCEFVEVEGGRQSLADISIVNEAGELVYHTYVKPKESVRDYLTVYSGMTEEKLRSVAVTLEDVQQTIRRYLPPDAILVGHSLNCDLKVMQMYHPYVIDTSLIYNVTGRKCLDKLKLLALIFLKRKIQQNLYAGHDPSEDAIAALDLVKLKLQNDFSYGNKRENGHVPQPTDDDVVRVVNIFDVVSSDRVSSKGVATYIAQSKCAEWDIPAIRRNEKVVTMVTKPDNEELVQQVCEDVMSKRFMFVHLEADEYLKSHKVKRRLEAIAKLDRQLSSIYNSLSCNAMFMVLFKASDETDSPDQQANNLIFSMHYKKEVQTTS